MLKIFLPENIYLVICIQNVDGSVDAYGNVLYKVIISQLEIGIPFKASGSCYNTQELAGRIKYLDLVNSLFVSYEAAIG